MVNRTGPRSKGRSGGPFRRVRAQVLSRSNGPLTCWFYGRPGHGDCPGLMDPAVTAVNPRHPMADSIHHIISLEDGGPELDPDNLVPAHIGCNSREANLKRYRQPASRDW